MFFSTTSDSKTASKASILNMSKEAYPSHTTAIDESGLNNVYDQPTKRRPWWKLGGKDSSFVSVNAGYANTTFSTSSSDTKLDTDKDLGRHVFETDDTKEIYKPIEGYEGAHRFDPSFQWTQEEERKLVRTVSRRYLNCHFLSD
jgi:hypothetical protein